VAVRRVVRRGLGLVPRADSGIVLLLWDNDTEEAIREIWNGQPFFSPPIAALLLKHWLNRGVEAKSGPRLRLTIRQAEVLQLIAEGYATKQIADVLLLSEKSVQRHRQGLMDKLGLHKVALLTRFAASNGAIESNRLPDWPSSPELRRQSANLHELACFTA